MAAISLRVDARQSTIRAFFLRSLATDLRDLGLDLDALCREHGLPLSGSAPLYEKLPLRGFVALAEATARTLGRPCLWLELGERFELRALGPFFPLFASARTLRAALDCFVRVHATWQSDTQMEVTRGAGTTAYSYAITDTAIWPRRQDAEFTLSSIVSLLRKLSNTGLAAVEVRFEHPVDAHRDRLKRFFHAQVLGDEDANTLVFRDEDLDRPMRVRVDLDGDDLMPILEQHLSDLLNHDEVGNSSFVGRAEALVSRRLGRARIEIADIAAELGFCERSFRRKLARAGTSYRIILEEQRLAKARAILDNGDVPLANLASRLSYSDPTVFSRAFKAWTGLSPRGYVQRNRLRPGA